MRYFLLILVLGIVTVFAIAGRRGDLSRRQPIEIFPDMDRQPKLRPQYPNEFFANGLSSQFPVPGTISRGAPFEDSAVNTGKVPGSTNFVAAIPMPVTAELMARGQERYGIYCAPCHGAAGDGKGITTKLGMGVIADLHDATARKIIQQEDGQIFNTITYGKNQMMPYGGLIDVQDRWAIIAYVRALQRSRLATLDDVAPGERAELIRGAVPTAGAAPAPAPPSAQPK